MMLATEQETLLLAHALGSRLEPGDVVLLEGELGAGKTFFAGGVCRALGVPDDVPVTSPTFGLVHELEGRAPILHCDFYRLRDPGELVELGLDERLGRDAVALIEHGERFARELGTVALVVRLAIEGPTARRCDIEARSERGHTLLVSLEAEQVHGAR
jgi:tRNA threonylcarbamoyladenosine biosynthesis protein TsaE